MKCIHDAFLSFSLKSTCDCEMGTSAPMWGTAPTLSVIYTPPFVHWGNEVGFSGWRWCVYLSTLGLNYILHYITNFMSFKLKSHWGCKDAIQADIWAWEIRFANKAHVYIPKTSHKQANLQEVWKALAVTIRYFQHVRIFLTLCVMIFFHNFSSKLCVMIFAPIDPVNCVVLQHTVIFSLIPRLVL